ncbi:hypothetical protein ACFU44_00700 [Nocardia rhizosphaerihabitans]|uniref:hypothetical protein n=1 Tax=Nocardia rhizosphaerihabitans TaxID=1691570 RepID=UPI00366EEBCC
MTDTVYVDDLDNRIRVLERTVMEKDAIIRELEAEKEELLQKLDNRPKLSDRDVQLIKRFFHTTGMSDRELADVFNVNPRTIGRIRTGEYHKDK